MPVQDSVQYAQNTQFDKVANLCGQHAVPLHSRKKTILVINLSLPMWLHTLVSPTFHEQDLEST